MSLLENLDFEGNRFVAVMVGLVAVLPEKGTVARFAVVLFGFKVASTRDRD